MCESKYGWMAVVQGRTLYADFADELHAVPLEVWTNRDKNLKQAYAWLRRTVNETVLRAIQMDRRKLVKLGRITAEEARAGDFSRLFLLKSDELCVFGIACMAFDVYPIENFTAREDGYRGEDIPVFLGYVSRIDRMRYPSPPHHAPVPSLDSIRRDEYSGFKSLFSVIAARWDDPSWKASGPPVLTTSDNWPFETCPEKDATDSKLLQRGSRSPVDRLWSASEAALAWRIASVANSPVRLCVGLLNRDEAERLGFANAVLRKIESDKPSLTRRSKVVPVRFPPIASSIGTSDIEKQKGAPTFAKPLPCASPLTAHEQILSQPPSRFSKNATAAIGAILFGSGTGIIVTLAGTGWCWALSFSGGVATCTWLLAKQALGEPTKPCRLPDASNMLPNETPTATVAQLPFATSPRATTALERATEAHQSNHPIDAPADDASAKKQPKW